MVQGTVNQEVPKTKKKEVPPLNSLGTVPKKSWDRVLGQWSWDTSLGTVVLGH